MPAACAGGGGAGPASWLGLAPAGLAAAASEHGAIFGGWAAGGCAPTAAAEHGGRTGRASSPARVARRAGRGGAACLQRGTLRRLQSLCAAVHSCAGGGGWREGHGLPVTAAVAALAVDRPGRGACARDSRPGVGSRVPRRPNLPWETGCAAWPRGTPAARCRTAASAAAFAHQAFQRGRASQSAVKAPWRQSDRPGASPGLTRARRARGCRAASSSASQRSRNSLTAPVYAGGLQQAAQVPGRASDCASGPGASRRRHGGLVCSTAARLGTRGACLSASSQCELGPRLERALRSPTRAARAAPAHAKRDPPPRAAYCPAVSCRRPVVRRSPSRVHQPTGTILRSRWPPPALSATRTGSAS